MAPRVRSGERDTAEAESTIVQTTLAVPDPIDDEPATENQLWGLQRWGIEFDEALTFDQASLMLSVLSYTKAMFQQETRADYNPPLTLQVDLMRSIFDDPELTTYIRRWNTARFAQAPDPDKPIRLRRNEHYERIWAEMVRLADEA